MLTKLQEIVDFLKENTNYNKDQMMMIINPLDTEEQADKFLNWVKNQEPMIWYEMRKKALEINQDDS